MSRIDKLWSAFLPEWIIANVIGWLIYAFLDAVKFNFIGFSLGAGLCIGFFQWLVLKRHMSVDTMWIFVSSLTYGIYIISLALVYGNFQALLVSTITLVLMGFLQRSVLDYNFDNSIKWVISSGIAGLSALIIISIMASLFLSERYFPFIWGVYGGVYGTITGLTLVGLYSKTIDKTRA